MLPGRISSMHCTMTDLSEGVSVSEKQRQHSLRGPLNLLHSTGLTQGDLDMYC